MRSRLSLRRRWRCARPLLEPRRAQLGFEQLEVRLALSAAPSDYERVTPAWFAAAPSVIGPQRPTSVPFTGFESDSTQWIIRLTPEAAQTAANVTGAATLLATLPIKVDRGLGLPGQLLVTSRGLSGGAVIAALEASPYVATFQYDVQINGSQLPNDPDVNGGIGATALSQYALLNIGQQDGTADADIDAELAWDVTTGSTSVVTAVIDSGIYYNHPDLAANIWTNPGEIAGDGLDNDQNGFIDDIHGWDFHNHDNDPVDDHGHGTHVASAIGAQGNNGIGVTGVNWATSLLPLKFLDENNVGSVVDAVAAINYATMMRTRAVNPVNVRVINASWGGAGVDDPALRAAIIASGAADILFVAAAGNGDVFGRGQNIDELPFFPASFNLDNMLVVAASDRHDELATFSNYGTGTVDVAAPGLSVWNADLFIDQGTTQPSFGTRSGTSMAAPLVSGTAALAWSSAPTATMAEVRDAILAGSDVKSSLQGKVAGGRRLNAYGALVSLPPQATVTSALDVTALGGASYQFTVQLSSNVGITAGSVGNGDFVVRRKNAAGDDLVATLVSATPSNGNKQWTATYQITPPGGTWDVFETGLYEILLVGGQLVDVNGQSSRHKAIDQFQVDLSGVGVYRPTLFTDGGPGSLREAITLANAVTPAQNPNGGAVILAPGNYTLSLVGAGEDGNLSGDLDVTGKVTVAGDGTGVVVINGMQIDRVFDVSAGGQLTINDVTVTGGNADGDGGGIRNAGTLNVETSKIYDNIAWGDGGGIYNSGVLTLNGDAIADNLSHGSGGGIFNTASATANVSHSTLNDNEARLVDEPAEIVRVGGDVPMHIPTAGLQHGPRVSFNDSGQGVLVWDSLNTTILAQRLDNDLNAVGSVFQVNDSTTDHGDVAVAPNGNFAVIYRQFNGDADAWGVRGKIYNSQGAVMKSEFVVNGNVGTNQSSHQLNAIVEPLPDGGYVVSWYDHFGGMSIWSQILNGDGTFRGAAFKVNVTIPGYTYENIRETNIWVTPDGVILYSYRVSNGGAAGDEVVGRRFTSAGTPLGGEFSISADLLGTDLNTAVAGDANGFAVMWRNEATGIYLRRFDALGQPLDAPTLVANPVYNFSTVSLEILPNGDFFSTWDDYQFLAGQSFAPLRGRVFGRDGAPKGAEYSLPLSASPQHTPSVVYAGNDHILAVWSGQGPGDDSGIFGAHFDVDHPQRGGDGGGVYNAGTLTATNVTISSNFADNRGGGLHNADSAAASFTNSTITANSAAGSIKSGGYLTPASDSFPINQNTSGSQNTVNLSVNAAGRAVITWTTAYSGLEQDTFARVLDDLTPGPGEWQVNPSHTAEIVAPWTAVDDTGRYLIGYQGWGIDHDWGVAAVGYQANGQAVGPYAMPQYTTGTQGNVRIATNGNDRFLVTWSDNARDGSGSGVFGRVVSSNLTALTGDFLISQSTAGSQVAGDSWLEDDNSMFILWGGAGTGDPSGNGIYGRRFDASGNPLTPEILINTTMAGWQDFSRIARLEDGYIVVWRGTESGYLFGQRLTLSGAKVGAEMVIAQTAPNQDASIDVAALPSGGFVVTYSKLNPSSGDFDVFAREYDREGHALRAPFLVDTAPSGGQYRANVGVDAEGNTLFVWEGAGPSDGSGIFARRFTFEADSAPGIFSAFGGNVQLTNTIVAGNSSGGTVPDLRGAFTSYGGNLIGNGGGIESLDQVSDQVGSSASPLDAKLGALANNGGPTQTHLPASDSPAIDRGVTTSLLKDQRGYDRVANGDNTGAAVVDVGAVERYHASIRGRKFEDRNENGVQDGSELGLSGWTIFLDLDHDGQLDDDERRTVTDANGDYAFEYLTPGSYTVAEVNQSGWTRTYTQTTFVEELLDSSNPSLALSNPTTIAATADGKFVYVAGTAEAKIQRFSRNAATGQLTALGTTTITDVIGANNALQNVVKLVVAPAATASGLYLYALSSDGALSVFSVNQTTGELTRSDVVKNGDARGVAVERMVGATGLAVSPDGLRIYVSNSSASALNGGTILAFERVTGQNPELRLRRILSNNASPASGTQGAGGSGVAVSPDGKHIYVAGATATSADTLSYFTRVADLSGTSTSPYMNYGGVLRNGQADSTGAIVSGLDGANDIVISADGKFVYVTAGTDNAVTLFARNATTGALTFVRTLSNGLTDDAGSVVDGVLQASSITISPEQTRVYVTGNLNLSSPEDPFLAGAVAVFARNVVTGRLTFLHHLIDGPPAENLDAVSDSISVGGYVYAIAGEDEDALTVFRRDNEGLDAKTLLVGEELSGVNFGGYAASGEIRGVVYNDLNNDGIRDGDENGLGGIAVYLDLNNNNALDVSEPTVATDPLGQYVFSTLIAPLTYTVRLKLSTNQTVTAPSASSDRERTIALNPDQTFLGADFSVHVQLAGVGIGTGQISGVIWNDANGDGSRQSTEPFFANRQVYLDVNDNGSYDAGLDILSAPTTSAGQYFFTNLGVANFVVRLIPAADELTTTTLGNVFNKLSLTTGADPLGLVTADFNLDGRPDLASADGNSDNVSVRLQLANGNFATRADYPVGSQPTGITVGDFNNDAYPDIAVVHWALSRIVFLINDGDKNNDGVGDGTFTRGGAGTEIPLPTGFTHLAAADVDLDGDDDLAVVIDISASNGNQDQFLFFQNNNGATPSFTLQQTIVIERAGPVSIAAGDLTGDGRAEFVVGNFDLDQVQVFRNNGGVSFTAQTPVSLKEGTAAAGPAAAVVVPDMNGDGKADVAVASVTDNFVRVFGGNGSGGLTLLKKASGGIGPRSVTAVDIDQDGDLDLIIGNTQSSDIVVLRRTSETGLQFSSPESTGVANLSSVGRSGVKQVLATDLNGDGVIDLAAVRGDSTGGALAVLRNAVAAGSLRVSLANGQNLSQQNFGVKSTVTAPTNPGDYDGDHDVDGADFLAWQRSFGSAATPAGSGADGNGNGTVDAADLAVWRTNFGSTAIAAAAAPSIALAVTAPVEGVSSNDYEPLQKAPTDLFDDWFWHESMFVQEVSPALLRERTARDHDASYETFSTASPALQNTVASVRSQTNSRDQAFSALGRSQLAEDDGPAEEEEVISARLAMASPDEGRLR